MLLRNPWQEADGRRARRAEFWSAGKRLRQEQGTGVGPHTTWEPDPVAAQSTVQRQRWRAVIRPTGGCRPQVEGVQPHLGVRLI